MAADRKKTWLYTLLIAGCCIGAFALFAGKIAFAGDSRTVDTLVMREDNPLNYRSADSSLQYLRNGDMVLRTGADATSYMLRMMNLTNKAFSHCGIVMIENDTPFVYHSIGGEDNPNACLLREHARSFFTPRTNERLGIVRLDLTPPQVSSLAAIVHRYHNGRIKFDMDFDLATDDVLYCAEFVYKAVREASADTAYFPLTHALGKTYVGVDNLYENPHARIICDIAYK